MWSKNQASPQCILSCYAIILIRDESTNDQRAELTTMLYLATGKAPKRVDSTCENYIYLPRICRMSDDEAGEDCPGNAALNMSDEVCFRNFRSSTPPDLASTGPRDPKLWFDKKKGVLFEAAPLRGHIFIFP